MAMKRNRTGSSSSCIETTASTAAAAAKVMRTDAAAAAAAAAAVEPNYTAAASPVKIGDFLERCHYCKKRIGLNSEVFMYSDFCAFCSEECRNTQIRLDQSAKKKP